MYTKICGYTILDQKGRMRHASLPILRSRSPSIHSYKEETQNPWRYSYLRASNSFHRYCKNQRTSSRSEKSKSRNTSTEDGSLYSSKEDLLDHPTHKHRYSRAHFKRRQLRGCSSSDDLLYDEYDISDGMVSSGIVETDGSVFSSQEDLLDSEVNCSANIYRFIHKRSISNKIYHKRENNFESIRAANMERGNVRRSKQVYIRKSDTSQNSESAFPPETNSDVGEVASTSLMIQKAVVYTIQRLITHLGKVSRQAKVLEEKCESLKGSLRSIEYDQYALGVKIHCLESHVDNIISDSEFKAENVSSKQVIKKDMGSNMESLNNPIVKTRTIFQHIFKNKISFPNLSHFQSLLNESQSAQLRQLPSNQRNFTRLLMILLVTLIAWDIRSAGSFYGSRLGKTAERFGLIPYLEVIGRTLKIGFIQSYKWCVLNIPIYYSRGCELAGPYLLLVLAKLEGAAVYIANGIESGSQYVPVLKAKLESSLPGASESLIKYSSAVVEAVQSTSSSAIEFAKPYVAHLQEVMMTRVFVGPLAPENLHQLVVRAFERISEVLFRVHTNIISALEDSDNINNKSA